MDPPEAFVEIPFTVEANYAGWRLDKYLQEKIRRLSRSRIQELIRTSLVSKRPLKPASLVQPGLHFALRRLAQAEPPTPDSFREVYRDEALLIIDKPAGLPMHPTARYHRGTLVSLIRRHYGDDFRADPAHRLDRETSGLVVCGRTLAACQQLMRLFVRGEVHKTYLAICEGWPEADAFEVEAAIAEGTAEVRVAVRIDSQLGKYALTRFRVTKRFLKNDRRYAVVEAQPATGRQHQIRIHLKHVGHPIVGDKMYGPDPQYFDRFSRGCLEPEAWERLELPRHALHAFALDLPHPTDGRSTHFETPLPADLQAHIDGASEG